MFKAKGNLVRINNNSIIAVMHEGFLGINHVVRIEFDEKFTKDILTALQHKKGKYGGTLAGKSLMQHKIEINIH